MRASTMTVVGVALALALAAGGCGDSTSGASGPHAPGAPEDAVGFEITLSGDKLPVLQGSSASIEVTLTRQAGFTADVALEAIGLPNGASTGPFTFRGDAGKATLTVTAAASAPHSLPTTATVTATANDKTREKPLTVTVHGRPGELDTSFAAGGKNVMSFGAGDDYVYAMAVQADGKVLVAGRAAEGLGDFALLRLERDGTPDASFGDGGKVTTAIGSGADTAYAIAVQPDGKIVVAGSAAMGTSGEDFALVRYEADGKLDAGFGDGGKVTASFGDDADVARALLVQPDGRIVVAGEASLGSGSTGVDFALARFEPGGALDGTFGQGGKTTTAIKSDAGRDAIYALAFQEIAGERCIVAAGGDGDFVLARYTEAGELDARFGAGGKVTSVWASAIGEATAIAIAPDGKIVAGGHIGHDFALARFDATGALDGAFGQGGKVLTKISTDNWDEAKAVALEDDGKILLGGWVYEGNSSSGNFALARFDATGALDATFGTGGISISEVADAAKTDLANAMVIQRDERIPATRVLLGGYASTSSYDVAVTRYWR